MSMAVITGSFPLIREDLSFFLHRSKQLDFNEKLRKRYARTAILYSAFYFESLSNFLCEKLGEQPGCLDTINEFLLTKDGWPEPLLRFAAVYLVLNMDRYKVPLSKSARQRLRNELPNADGIRDLFTVRNKMLGHTTSESFDRPADGAKNTGPKANRVSRIYHKLQLPDAIAEIDMKHAQKLYSEVVDFLESYRSLLDRKYSDPSVISLLSQKKV
jgi:hypothetical protein